MLTVDPNAAESTGLSEEGLAEEEERRAKLRLFRLEKKSCKNEHILSFLSVSPTPWASYVTLPYPTLSYPTLPRKDVIEPKSPRVVVNKIDEALRRETMKKIAETVTIC